MMSPSLFVLSACIPVHVIANVIQNEVNVVGAVSPHAHAMCARSRDVQNTIRRVGLATSNTKKGEKLAARQRSMRRVSRERTGIRFAQQQAEFDWPDWKSCRHR